MGVSGKADMTFKEIALTAYRYLYSHEGQILLQLSPLGATVLTAIFTLLLYMYRMGSAWYWGIPIELIDLFGRSAGPLYMVACGIILYVPILLISAFSFSWIKKRAKGSHRAVAAFLLIIILIFVSFGIAVLSELLRTASRAVPALVSAFMQFLSAIPIFAIPGIVLSFFSNRASKGSNVSDKKNPEEKSVNEKGDEGLAGMSEMHRAMFVLLLTIVSSVVIFHS